TVRPTTASSTVRPARQSTTCSILLQDAGTAFGGIPLGSDGARRPTRHATDAFEELSAARDVVLDKQKTTIWRESPARVGTGAATQSWRVWTSAWTIRPLPRIGNELTDWSRANKMLMSCRPERRHILFRPRRLMLRSVPGAKP